MLVEARTLGRRGAVLAPTAVPMPDGPTTLRRIIEVAVRREVEAYGGRERDRRLVRVLTPDEIADGAAAGTVDPSPHPAEAPVDVDGAVTAALQAFGDGLYYAFVDESRVDHLDDGIDVTDDTTVRFVRLVALAGG